MPFSQHCKTITFTPCCTEDLVEIIEDRVGNKVFHPEAIEFAAKKVSAISGDARAVLELASRAVTMCATSLSPNQLKATTDKPVVTLKNMFQANKVRTPIADTIEALPEAAKVILCVAVTLNQVENMPRQMTVGLLRDFSMKALSEDELRGDELDLSVFIDLLQQLFDAGLMLHPNHHTDAYPFNVAAPPNHNLFSTPISLGVHLCDVESALEETLGNQPHYRDVLDRARELAKSAGNTANR